MKYYAYVVIFTGVTSEHVVRTIDKFDTQVPNWYTPPLPQTVFIVSPLPAQGLAKFLRKHLDLKHLLVLDAETDRNGWLPSAAWDFLRDPKPASRS